jgi:hypothetical protein
VGPPETGVGGTHMGVQKYRSLVGKLLHIARTVRWDCRVVVHELSMATTPIVKDWDRAIHVARYMLGTKKMRLRYQPPGGDEESEVIVYADASCPKEGGEARAGVFVEYNGMPIMAETERIGVQLSTTAAEAAAADLGARYAMGVQAFVNELRAAMGKDKVGMKVLTDCEPAMKMMLYGGSKRTRHERGKAAHLVHMLDTGQASIDSVRSAQQKADGLTKCVRNPNLKHMGLECPGRGVGI